MVSLTPTIQAPPKRPKWWFLAIGWLLIFGAVIYAFYFLFPLVRRFVLP